MLGCAAVSTCVRQYLVIFIVVACYKGESYDKKTWTVKPVPVMKTFRVWKSELNSAGARRLDIPCTVSGVH